MIINKSELEEMKQFNKNVVLKLNHVYSTTDCILMFIHLGQYVLYNYSKKNEDNKYVTGADVVKRNKSALPNSDVRNALANLVKIRNSISHYDYSKLTGVLKKFDSNCNVLINMNSDDVVKHAVEELCYYHNWNSILDICNATQCVDDDCKLEDLTLF